MSRRLAVALTAAALAVAACTAEQPPVDTAGPGPACNATPSPTMTHLGGFLGPLPDEIRCLPHVTDGVYSYTPAELSLTRRDMTTVSVTVTPDTTRDQARALCLRITDLGYGLGGAHHVDVLTVSGGAATYRSLAGLSPCRS